MQLFDDEFADRLPVRRARRRPRSSPRSRYRSGASAGWCSTGSSTTSSPRPSRSRSAPRTSCPGIDFTNDPLLQGRNFSYLDTQLKRLGSPNFTHLPINAPKCPFAHFQQDGHMAMRQPGRPGQLRAELVAGDAGGPREDPASGFQTFAERRTGDEAARPLRELRRPLQPGAPVLRQPDADRAAAHRRRVRVRAEQGASGPTSARGWSPTCATSTRTSPPRVADGLGSTELPDAATPAAGADHRPRRRRRRSASCATARRRSRAASSACSSPTAPTPTLLAALRRGARRRRCDCSSSSPRSRRRRRSATAAASRRDQKIDGGPSVLYDAVVDRSPRPTGAAHAGRGRRGARTSCPTRSRTASSSATSPPRSRCSTRPAWPAELDAGFVALDAKKGVPRLRRAVPGPALLGSRAGAQGAAV